MHHATHEQRELRSSTATNQLACKVFYVVSFQTLKRQVLDEGVKGGMESMGSINLAQIAVEVEKVSRLGSSGTFTSQECVKAHTSTLHARVMNKFQGNLVSEAVYSTSLTMSAQWHRQHRLELELLPQGWHPFRCAICTQ